MCCDPLSFSSVDPMENLWNVTILCRIPTFVSTTGKPSDHPAAPGWWKETPECRSCLFFSLPWIVTTGHGGGADPGNVHIQGVSTCSRQGTLVWRGREKLLLEYLAKGLYDLFFLCFSWWTWVWAEVSSDPKTSSQAPEKGSSVSYTELTSPTKLGKLVFL